MILAYSLVCLSRLMKLKAFLVNQVGRQTCRTKWKPKHGVQLSGLTADQRGPVSFFHQAIKAARVFTVKG